MLLSILLWSLVVLVCIVLYGCRVFITDRLFYKLPRGPMPLPFLGLHKIHFSTSSNFVKTFQEQLTCLARITD